MQSGELDQKIELQSQVEVNDHGSYKQTYTTFATVWGRIITPRGSEAFESARTTGKESIRVCIRYRNDVNAQTKIKWNNQVYNVMPPDRSLRRKGELWFNAEAGDAS